MINDTNRSGRGFFEIGIYNPRHNESVGTLWRTAYQLGASGVFTIGEKPKRQCSDTYKTWRRIPMRHYAAFSEFFEALPHSTPLIGIEFPGTQISNFAHPQRAVYLLGSETDGIPEHILQSCAHVVELPSVRQLSYNVAIAGGLVMYDRFMKGMVDDE